MQRRKTTPVNVAVVVALDLDRPPAVHALDALLVALANLDGVGRHLLQRLQRHEAHAPRAGQARRGARRVVRRLAHHRAGDVVGDVAAADDDDLVSQVDGLTDGHGAQQIDAAVDARPALARQAEGTRALRADGDDHRGVLTAESVEADVLADGDAGADLDTQRLDHRHLALDQLTRQTVLGHTDGEHAGGYRFAVEDHRLEAHQGEIVRRRQAGRSGADDRDALPVRRLEPATRVGAQQRRHLLGVRSHAGHEGAHRVEHGVWRTHIHTRRFAREAFQCADGDRPIDAEEVAVIVDPRNAPAAAGRFARRAADAPADRGERIRSARDEVGFLETPGGNGAHVAARVGVYRTGDLAGDQIAVVALAGHLDGEGCGHRARHA